MKNLVAKLKAIKSDVSVTNQFEISIQIGSAINSASQPNYFYEEIKGNKEAVLKALSKYVKRIQAEMFEDEYGFLAFLNCRVKDRNWDTKDVFSFKIEAR